MIITTMVSSLRAAAAAATASASSDEELDESWSTASAATDDDDGHAHTMLNKKRQAERTPSSYRNQMRKYLFVGQRRTRRQDRSHVKFELPMSVSNTRTTVDVL